MDISQILSDHIERRGCTQAWLARKCDVTTNTINNVVRGYTSPSVELRTALCNALDLGTEDALKLMQAPKQVKE